MRLMTLNIRYGSGADHLEKPGYDLPSSPAKLAAIGAAIHAVKPDIVALQEVRNQLQAENLARLTGLDSIYMSHPLGYRLFFFEWGLAFLHRPTLLSTRSRAMLIDKTSGIGRNGLLCSLSIDGKAVTVINVHFDHQQQGLQMENVLQLLAEITQPICLLGDFNCAPESPLLAGLKDRLADTCQLAGTESSQQAMTRGTLVEGQMRGDYIWVDPHRFAVHEAGLVADQHRKISDHLGYFADVTLS